MLGREEYRARDAVGLVTTGSEFGPLVGGLDCDHAVSWEAAPWIGRRPPHPSQVPGAEVERPPDPR